MSTEIERLLAENLDVQLERYPGAWGLQASRMADGIRQSGLTEQQDKIDKGISEVNTSISSLAAVMGHGFGDLTRQLVSNNRMLQGVIDSLRNPLDTQADERYRRGVTALQHSWFPEAVSEFRAAVAANPYQPLAHVLLGIAQAEENDHPGAIASFEKAYRYGTPGEPEIATGAVILAVTAIEQESGVAAALELVNDALMTYPGCAELGLIHSRLSRTDEFTRSSLWLAPILAVPAMVGGSHGVPEASELLVREVGGPIDDAAAISNTVQRYTEETDDESAELLPAVHWSASECASDAELMTGAGRVLLRAPRILSQVRFAHAAAREADEHNTRQLQYKIDDRTREIENWTTRDEFLHDANAKTQRKAIPYHIGAGLVLIVLMVLYTKFGILGAIAGMALVALYLVKFYASILNKLYRANKNIRDHSVPPELDRASEKEMEHIARHAAKRDMLLSQLENLVSRRAHHIIPWSRSDHTDTVPSTVSASIP